MSTCTGCGRPKLLDLFCCAGGASMGFHRAGFCVTGVDIAARPHYPFRFVQADAIAFVKDSPNLMRESYAAVAASPPCQADCALMAGTNADTDHGHVSMLAATRTVLEYTGLPYVIENPIGQAKMRADLVLCGEQFGLGVLRHRQFELGRWGTPPLPHVPHRGYVRGWRHGVYRDGPYIAAYGKGGGKGTVAEMQAALGIDWTDVHEELTEAIPPAYTEWIGARLLKYLDAEAAA